MKSRMEFAAALMMGFCLLCLLGKTSSRALQQTSGGYSEVFEYPDPNLGCDSSWVEQVEPFHKNVEQAVDGVVSKAPERGKFHTTEHQQNGGVSIEVEANCDSDSTHCSECLRSVSDGLLHFCEARLVGFGRIPSNDGCSLRYQAYGSF